MNLVENHRRRYPNARPTTISDKYREQATFDELRAEVEALHRANTYSARVHRQPVSIIERMKIIGLWMWRR